MSGMNEHLLKINKKRFDKLNITKWHDKGITGKNVKIAVIGESNNSHHAGSWLIKQVATGAEVVTLDTTTNRDFSWDNALQYCLDNDIDIVCVSYQIYSVSNKFKELSQKLHGKNTILLCASHNDGREIRDYPVTLSSWYATGAYNGRDGRMGYSNYGDRLLCLGYTSYANKNYKGDYIPISHTSGTPQVIAGMAALLKELKPNLTIAEFEEFVADNSMRLNTEGWNKYEGWGLFKLPREIPIGDDIPKREDVDMKFIDVPEGKWSADDIDLVTKYKVMQGYEDGKFRPKENITREEVAAVAANLIRLIDEVNK